MRTISRVTLAALVLLFSVGIVACSGGSPTASSTAPAGPHLESGIGFGSGNVVPPNNNAAADSGSTATERGGSTFGSGN